jgi:hypothetical protein
MKLKRARQPEAVEADVPARATSGMGRSSGEKELLPELEKVLAMYVLAGPRQMEGGGCLSKEV